MYNSIRPGQVWLDTDGKPIEWEGDKPVIRWQKEWRPEELK